MGTGWRRRSRWCHAAGPAWCGIWQPEQFEQLLASLDKSSPRGLRDRAIILCIARLGLRASEVAALRLEDIDWRSAVCGCAPARPATARCCP